MKKPYYQILREKLGKQTLLLPAVAVLVQNEKREILLVRKKKSKLWAFPGGYVELDESIEKTAKREVLEETGFIIEPSRKVIGVCSGKKFTKQYFNGDSVQPLIIFIEAKIKEQRMRTDEDEIVEAKFFPFFDPPPLEKCCRIKYRMLRK